MGKGFRQEWEQHDGLWDWARHLDPAESSVWVSRIGNHTLQRLTLPVTVAFVFTSLPGILLCSHLPRALTLGLQTKSLTSDSLYTAVQSRGQR